MRKSDKSFDSVEMKRQAQRRIYERIKDLSPEQEIAYFDRAVRSGPFAEFWRKLEEGGRASRLSGRAERRPTSERDG